MATLDEVKAILTSGRDPAHKLDALGALVFKPEPEPVKPAPAPTTKAKPVEPKPAAA